MRKNDPKLLCWQCNKQLYQSYATIEFNGSQIKVHHTCKKDAENLLLRNEPTFQGEFNPSNAPMSGGPLADRPAPLDGSAAPTRAEGKGEKHV